MEREGLPLVERLAAVADSQWRGLNKSAGAERGLVSLVYSGKKYACRRKPEEIESVLSFLDKAAIDLLQRSFDGGPLGLWEFLRAVVQTGTYKPDSLLPFVAGAVDLFLEVMWSRIARNPQTTDRVEIHWGDLMNHLLERPEMVFWGGGVESKPMEMYCSRAVDGQKHAGPHSISGLVWIRHVNITATIENGPSVCMRSQSSPPSKVRDLTPELPSNFSGLPIDVEFKVLAIGWDEKQDLVALLSNRMMVQWRLRNQGSIYWQQLRVLLARPSGPSTSSSPLGAETGQPTAQEKGQERKACVYLHALSRRSGMDEESWLQELQTDKKAKQDAMQVAIWWSSRAQQWIASNPSGRLFFWDLRVFDQVIDGSDIVCLNPTRVLEAHTDVVTGYTELDPNHFATCSMDQTIALWDSRFYVREAILRGHPSGVLSQAYLKCSSCLVSVGHERLVHVWSITISGTGASRAKLKGHEANLLRVAASERVFFTLDEAADVLLWDATYLTCLQTLSCGSWKPEHMFCMPSKSRICVAGRRLNFIEANEALAVAMGASPSLEEQALKQRLQDTVNLKRSGAPRWCGLSASRGCFLSATEYEVRFHPRSRPAQPRVVFSAPEGDLITAFCASGRLSIATCCTARGDIYLLKYRSGYVTAVHKTRGANPEEALANAGNGLSEARSEGYSDGGGRARGAPSESSEAARRSKFDSQSASALDASVHCVAICEKLFRVYAGLSEGQVLVIACEPGFPIVRQLTNPKDTSAVTCLHCSEDTGLLAVGTHNGLVHLYVLEHLRMAGSMNIPLFRRRGPGRGSPLQSLHLFDVPVNPELPLTLLTVSESSRVQLWGLRVHSNEGKLALVHVVRDLHQLRAVHPAPGSKEARGRQGENAWLSGHKLVECLDEERLPNAVKVTAMTVVSGRMALPGRPTEGLEEDVEDDAPGNFGRCRASEESEEVVAERLRLRPRTPPGNRWQAVEVDASRFAFVADASGWIWCVDIPGSISASLEQQETLELPLNPTRKQQLYRRLALKTQPSKGTVSGIGQLHFAENGAANTTLSISDTVSSEEEAKPLVLQTPVAWLAHSSGVATLTFTGPFPALVTVGLDKDVKVWSTQGDLWGHFNMLATEGQPAPAVWPPPQVLASQVALMGIAREFCGGVGRRSSIFLSLKGAGRKWRRSSTSAVRRGSTIGMTEGAVRSSSRSLADSPKNASQPFSMSRSGSTMDIATPGAAGSKSPPHSNSPKGGNSPPPRGAQEHSPTRLSRISERRPLLRRRSSAAVGVAAGKGEDAEIASPVSQSTACTTLPREQASPSSPKSDTETAEAGSPQQASDDAQLSDDSLLTSPTSGSPGRGRRAGFTSEQMEQMVQNHAFSSGCRSFQEFCSHTQARMFARTQTQGIRERALRSDFWNRPTSGLGISLDRSGSKEPARPKGMGRKAASESALLRYVQGSVAEMTRTVREDMGVDVQAVTREQIMRTSFIGRLDLAGVSHDPSDATSVTSQIAKQLSRPPREKRKLPSIFANTGESVTGGNGRRGAHSSPQRGRTGAPKA